MNSRTTEHTVLLEDEYYMKLTGGDILPEELIQNAIRFLLREESVHEFEGRFDLAYVQRLFPDFEKEMRKQAKTVQM
ncbi:MAG: hypothetical protein AAF649_02465 [Verrucomicrobiota bacterium]